MTEGLGFFKEFRENQVADCCKFSVLWDDFVLHKPEHFQAQRLIFFAGMGCQGNVSCGWDDFTPPAVTLLQMSPWMWMRWWNIQVREIFVLFPGAFLIKNILGIWIFSNLNAPSYVCAALWQIQTPKIPPQVEILSFSTAVIPNPSLARDGKVKYWTCLSFLTLAVIKDLISVVLECWNIYLISLINEWGFAGVEKGEEKWIVVFFFFFLILWMWWTK